MDDVRGHASSHRATRLAEKMRDKDYRDRYVEAHTRRFLALQMRKLRGGMSQAEFAACLDKKQTVISRLEDPAYTGWSLRTIFEVARKLDVAAVVRFVDFSTFLTFTGDQSEAAARPAPYDQAIFENEARSTPGDADNAYTSLIEAKMHRVSGSMSSTDLPLRNLPAGFSQGYLMPMKRAAQPPGFPQMQGPLPLGPTPYGSSAVDGQTSMLQAMHEAFNSLGHPFGPQQAKIANVKAEPRPHPITERSTQEALGWPLAGLGAV